MAQPTAEASACAASRATPYSPDDARACHARSLLEPAEEATQAGAKELVAIAQQDALLKDSEAIGAGILPALKDLLLRTGLNLNQAWTLAQAIDACASGAHPGPVRVPEPTGQEPNARNYALLEGAVVKNAGSWAASP